MVVNQGLGKTGSGDGLARHEGRLVDEVVLDAVVLAGAWYSFRLALVGLATLKIR